MSPCPSTLQSPSVCVRLLCLLLLLLLTDCSSSVPRRDPVTADPLTQPNTTHANCTTGCDDGGVAVNATDLHLNLSEGTQEDHITPDSASSNPTFNDSAAASVNHPSNQQPASPDHQGLSPATSAVPLPSTPTDSTQGALPGPITSTGTITVTPPELMRNVDATTSPVTSKATTPTSTATTPSTPTTTPSTPTTTPSTPTTPTFTPTTTPSTPTTTPSTPTTTPSTPTTTPSTPTTPTFTPTTTPSTPTTTPSTPTTPTFTPTTTPSTPTTTPSTPTTPTFTPTTTPSTPTTTPSTPTTTPSTPTTPTSTTTTRTSTAEPTAKAAATVTVATTTGTETAPPPPSAAPPQPNAPSTGMPPVQTSLPRGPTTLTATSTRAPADRDKPGGVVDVAGGGLTSHLVDTASLLAVLLFGLLFFFVTVAVFVTQAYESYRRKDYTQVDYLINGMYSDSGV